MAIRFYVPVDSIEPSVKKFRGWLAVDAPTHRKGKREERGRGDQVGKSSRLKDIFKKKKLLVAPRIPDGAACYAAILNKITVVSFSRTEPPKEDSHV